jgi:serralysin
VGGSDTHYAVAGVGDFTGNGTDDILFRNNSTGYTWFEAIGSGSFVGWDQIGGSNTSYAVVGVGDYSASGADDILFRNNSTGDTWSEAISNGLFNSWKQVGGSNTSYTVNASPTYDAPTPAVLSGIDGSSGTSPLTPSSSSLWSDIFGRLGPLSSVG